MIMTKSIKYEDIIKNLDKENDVISIIGCNTCIRVNGPGGPDKMRELALKLKSDGYNVKDGFLLPDACVEPYLAPVHLSHEINTIIALSCSAGLSNIARNYADYKVVATVEDVGLMIGDATVGNLKLIFPYKKYKDLKGEEFEMFSDGKVSPTKHLKDVEA